MVYPVHYTISITDDESGSITSIGVACTQFAGLETNIQIPVSDGVPDYESLARHVPPYVRAAILPALSSLVEAMSAIS